MQKRTPGYPRGQALAAAVLAAVLGALLAPGPAGAGPAGTGHPARSARLSIASPATGNLVAGLVPVAVAFDAGAGGRVTLVELWVDDLLYESQSLDPDGARGTCTIDWDTARLRNGQHSLKVRAFAGRKLIAVDSALVTVSNGGPDVVPPLVSFYAPLDGEVVSGSVNIGINASDNDQVALVGLFVNKQLRMMKSDPPYQYTLDTTTLPLLNGRGSLLLEAWAYDRAQNRGVAKPVTVFVQNSINATPMEPDPKQPKGGKSPASSPAGHPSTARSQLKEPPALSKAEPSQPARLSPLAALAPANAAPTPDSQPRLSTPAAPPEPQPSPSSPSAGKSRPALPPLHLKLALGPRPSSEVKTIVPPAPSSRPIQSAPVIQPHAMAPLKVALSAPPAAAVPTGAPRTVEPGRARSRSAGRERALKPAAVHLKLPKLARVPDGELLAVPRLPAVTAPRETPRAVPPQAAASRHPASLSVAVAPARTAAKPANEVPARTVAPRAPAPVTPRPTRRRIRPAVSRARLLAALPHPQEAAVPVAPAPRAAAPKAVHHPEAFQRGSTPDRIVLPVYRLARLPESPSAHRGYTVQRGDTLGTIARRHEVTPRSILVANGLGDASEVSPGRRLTIPGTITIAYNDEPVGFDVSPRIEQGMAITPFRQLFEHTGGEVRYEPAGREVQARNPEKEIRLKIGSREALVNSAVVLMDRAAFLDSGRTMVPVKFMTQALDLKAEYDVKTGAIYLIHK